MGRTRSKKKEPVTATSAETTSPATDETKVTTDTPLEAPAIQADQIIHGVAESMKMPEDIPPTPPATASGGPGTVRAHGHGSHSIIANPSSKRRESHVESVRKLPSKYSVVAGDLRVQLIDAGRNEMGIGIRVEVPEGRTLTDDEKAIIREHVKGTAEQPSGFSWDKDVGMWHKHILRDGEHVDEVPSRRPIAIRLDAERRIENLAEALRVHSADPVGYAAMVQQRREQAANAERIPD